MTSGFIAEFADMMTDELVVVPGALDYRGDFVASGSEISAPCRVQAKSMLVRDSGGLEVVSSVQAYLGGYYDLTTDAHRYTLPARFAPRSLLTALSVGKLDDEGGACYEVVYFR